MKQAKFFFAAILMMMSSAVMAQTETDTVYYKEGKKTKYYINQAGGVTSTGKKSKAIIIYMNGMVAKADRKHKPMPGCQIVVPTKSRHGSLSVPEILSIGSSTASIAAMIATIVNLSK